MTKKRIRSEQYSDLRGTLYLAFELGMKEWKLGFSIGLGQKARRRTIPGGDLEKLQREIAAAKKRFELSETAPVVSCYETDRGGFGSTAGIYIGDALAASLTHEIHLIHSPQNNLS